MSHEGDDYVKLVPTPSDRERSCVRLIFDLASKGWSVRRIASHLNEMDISIGPMEHWGYSRPLANAGEQVAHGG